jgi:multidrug resistance protein, MATE family
MTVETLKLETAVIADREPSALGEVLRLGLPTVAQMMSYTLMQFIDTWMLSHLGTVAPTAGANAGLFSFAFICMGMGVLFVVNTLVSQSYGQKNFADCGRYLWQGIWFSLGFSVVLIPLIPILPRAFTWFGHEPELVRMESIYLAVMLATAVFKMIGTTFSQFLLATNRSLAVMVSTICGVSVNAVAAGLMIFKFKLGITGAAWGQVIGVLVETAVLIAFAMRLPFRRQFNALDWSLRSAQLWKLIKVGVPAGFQIVADVLAWSLFGNWVMAKFGTTGMAANNFMMRYMVVSFMPAFGISTAVTALVGRYIGMGKPDAAMRRAHIGFMVTAIYMLCCGTVFFVGRNQLIRVFSDDPQVLRAGATLLVFAAIYQFFDAVYILYNGALRGAGDTLVPAIATGVLCWGITVFGGWFVASHYTRFGVAGPWTVATVYGIILGIFMFLRFQSGKWRRIKLSVATTG